MINTTIRSRKRKGQSYSQLEMLSLVLPSRKEKIWKAGTCNLHKGKLKTLMTWWFSEKQDSAGSDVRPCTFIKHDTTGSNRCVQDQNRVMHAGLPPQCTHLHGQTSSHQCPLEFHRVKGLCLWICLEIWSLTL